MNINKLKSPLINQNGYHKNILTKERIGTLFIYPIDFTPDDCLSCDGYSLLIIDYEDLYKIIGTRFNQADDAEGTFRVPDYNITGRFLQPGYGAGNQIAAGLPNIIGKIDASSSDANCEAFGETHPNQITGAFEGIYGYQSALPDAAGGVMLRGFNFDASRSSFIYGNSTTVQPPSQLVHICIKYK